MSNYKNLPLDDAEPDGHVIGRSRGGLTTKIHHAVDGRGLALAIAITYRAGAVLHACLTWATLLGDTP